MRMLHLGTKLRTANPSPRLGTFGEPLVTSRPISDATQNAVGSRPNLLRKTAVVIPTYNASRYWKQLHSALVEQGLSKEQVLVVDSSSTDDTRELVRRAGYPLKQITKESFRHGATRQMAADSLSWAEFLVYVTQDAIPCGDSSIEKLLEPFRDPEIGAVCGRQIARDDASPIERHARLFNYPDVSNVRTFGSRTEIGIKAAFLSNSFAAYRHTALDQIGGFPVSAIALEDMTAAARMLIANWKIVYQAEAIAIHSHPFSMRQEFARYFDTGVHHGRAPWLLQAFGGAGEEGRSFVVSQMKFLLDAKPSMVPEAMIRNMSKWFGYQLGLREKYLPFAAKKRLSGYRHFWEGERANASAAREGRYRVEPVQADVSQVERPHKRSLQA